MRNLVFLVFALILTFILVGILIVSPVKFLPITGTGNAPMDTACQNQFGEQWDARGYMAGNPPVIQCKGPDGTTGYMDMPPHVAQEMDIVATAYNQTRTKDGKLNLSGLPLNTPQSQFNYCDRTKPYNGGN